jgi:hypothetical protein
MAVSETMIETVRVIGADGIGVEYPWKPGICYMIRDDHPYLDFLTRGHAAQPHRDAKISKLSEGEDGTQWQRWELSEELSRQRRLGELSAVLKVPKDCVLRCYVVPVALLSYRDVVAMAEDIETELGFAAVWDMVADRIDRTWSQPDKGARSSTPPELMRLVDEEIRGALSIRHDPFTELGPRSRYDAPLAENALVSHWAARRSGQLRDLIDGMTASLETVTARSDRHNPARRQSRIEEGRDRLRNLCDEAEDLKIRLAGLVDGSELSTPIAPSPLFQRDHRLRMLLRAFAPSLSEALSENESTRSHFPPLFLNRLWELWGIVWIAMELRRMGFAGRCSVEAVDAVQLCSWYLTRDDVVIELDFEAEPALTDYERLPPVHERNESALEWAARNQDLDVDRPFLGLEEKCSPDYLIRVTTRTQKALLVGDACLASPHHHGKKGDKSDSKPYTVERYRRTIGWAAGDAVIRCHPMGGFVVFPAPSEAWTAFETLPGASDCALLCPSPSGDPEASRRLARLFASVLPAFDRSSAVELVG